MKTPYYLLISIFFLLISCQEKEEPIGDVETFWVYSYPVPCDQNGNAHTMCLGISTGDEFDFERAPMERIPFEIKDFSFKPYYFQKIQVQKFKNLNTKKVSRKLIRILAEERDYYNLLEGTWKVKRYFGEDLPNKNFPNGQTVSILPGSRMAISRDGCNSISLQIKKVGANNIISFGDAITTLIACPPEQLIIPFPGLEKNFKREGNILTFISEEEGVVAVWEKIN